jgi:23S rRNA pseudouridine2605 synthase
MKQRRVSLARAISKLGFASRMQGEKLVLAGRIAVNGQVVKHPAFRVDVARDEIAVDGSVLSQKQRFMYVAMNKPVGVVTTRSDEKGRKTVYDFFQQKGGGGSEQSWLFPVGRLDKETSGLLLFTTDTRFAELLTNPRTKSPKTYRARLNKVMTDEDVEKLSRGVIINEKGMEYHTLPARVRLCGENQQSYWIEITIVEGRNRQIRKMCEALGYQVLELQRIKIGDLHLEHLKAGESRRLTNNHLTLLTRGSPMLSRYFKKQETRNENVEI